MSAFFNFKKIVFVLAVLLAVSVYKHFNNNRAIVNLGRWRDEGGWSQRFYI